MDQQPPTRSETIEAELAPLWRVFLAEETSTEERHALREKIDPLRAEFQQLNADKIAAAQVAFATNKPNPPEHAAFIERAVQMYPKLPVGAAQNALHCLEIRGPAAAKRYVANAAARLQQNERALMGTTLAAWRAKRAEVVPTYVTPGRWRDSPKRQREERERLERYRAHMAGSQVKVAREREVERKKAERRLAAALAAVSPPKPPRENVVTSDIVTALVDMLRAPGGISYVEAASRLNLQPKGDKPHHAPAAQVRAMVRDKVRKLHPVVTVARDPARGGAVYMLAAQ